MRTHKELKEFVKSLCADEADILMDLLPSVMKSKRSNQWNERWQAKVLL